MRALVLLSLCLAAAPAASQGLLPRQPLDPGEVRVPVLTGRALADLGENPPHQLEIKLVDAVKGRATPEGSVVSRVGAELGDLRELLGAAGATVSQLIMTDEERLVALEQRAAARSGRAQPDLAGLLLVELPGADSATLAALGNMLRALPEVEFAQLQLIAPPPPGDIAPFTPDLTSNQGYFNPNNGMDVDFAHAFGFKGAGVRIADCEYGWNPDHEDLVDRDIGLEPGQTIAPGVYSNGWDSHGTAVIGETSGVENAYGVTGMAVDADLATYTEWSVEQGFRRVTAVTNAIADSVAGDVVLLEMQTTGAGGGYGPAELSGSVFSVCKAGVDAGVVVVGAAGNGNQNLDSAAYTGYQNMGDSGAIIVGAGTNSTSHNKLSFSTYGSRVNVQGWGTSVFTLGYGGFAQYGGDKNQRYTSSFSGTSSASPFVASACAILQAEAKASLGNPVPPTLLRQLLMDTGYPQGTGGNIGPLPNIQAALSDLGTIDVEPAEWTDLGGGLAGLTGIPTATGTGTLFPESDVSLSLFGARGNSQAWLVLGLSRIDAPFKGGVMVPALDIIVGPKSTGLLGLASVQATLPSTVIPSTTELFFQWWVADGAAPVGYAGSNALRAYVP